MKIVRGNSTQIISKVARAQGHSNMKKNFSILMVAMHLDYRIHGGLSRHAYELCKALNRLGCQVFVSCVKNDALHINNKIEVSSFPSIAFLDFLSFNLNLPRKTRDYDIDVVHSQADRGFIFALMKNRPLVVTAHSSMKIGLRAVPRFLFRPSPYFRILTEKCTFMKADKVIAVSKSTSMALQNDYGVSKEKIVCIPNAVDVEKFSPNLSGEIIRRKYEVNGPLLLCVARLEVGRYVEKLIPMVKAVKKEFPNIKLIIVGDGPSKQSLQRLCLRHRLTSSVTLTGSKGDKELPYFYAAADLCVQPMVYTPAIKEFNVLEAMACGKVLVYVDRMGLKNGDEIISEGNPIAVSSDKNFVESIIYLLQNEKKRKELGIVARKAIMERFSWEKVAEKTIEVYESVV